MRHGCRLRRRSGRAASSGSRTSAATAAEKKRIASTGVWVVDPKAYKGKLERRETGPIWRRENQVYVAGRIAGGPGERVVYHPGYYGAFVLDTDS